MGNGRGKKPPFTGLESPAIAGNGVVAIAEFRALGLVDGIFEENRARSAEKLSFDQTKIVRLLLNASLPTSSPRHHHQGPRPVCGTEPPWRTEVACGGAGGGAALPSRAIACRRAIRSSIGGWVENRPDRPPAESGLSM